MSQINSALRSELEAIRSIHEGLRSKIGDACFEQRARFSELDSQLVKMTQALQSQQEHEKQQNSEALLEEAAQLRADLVRLDQHFDHGWAGRLIA